MEKRKRILVVDDDTDFSSILAARLEAQNMEASTAGSAMEAMGVIQERPPDVVLLDIGLPDSSGLEMITQLKAIDSTLPIIMVTARADLETAIAAIKRGAYDYISKPIAFDSLWIKIINAIQSHTAFKTIDLFEKELSVSYSFNRFIYRSERMAATVEQLRQLAESDATVLITGESGVGKELAARTLHSNGARRLAPFVPVSCAAVPETLIENELFGHEKGSFTDAIERGIGKFEQANGGTIFLDEIGELSPMMQTKLLRVLQERSFQRIGGVRDLAVDVRVIAATNRDLNVEIAEGRFRSDLFYRLSVLPIAIPPLRERPEDILLMADHFLQLFSHKVNKRFAGFSPEARAHLESYPWPGNVRELQNAIERAVVFGTPPTVGIGDISFGPAKLCVPAAEHAASTPHSTLKEVEASHIAGTLRQCGWNISQAAHHLGIGRDTLYRKIRQYGIKGAGGGPLSKT